MIEEAVKYIQDLHTALGDKLHELGEQLLIKLCCKLLFICLSLCIKLVQYLNCVHIIYTDISCRLYCEVLLEVVQVLVTNCVYLYDTLNNWF